MEPMGFKDLSFGHGLAQDLIDCATLAQFLVLTGKFQFSFQKEKKTNASVYKLGRGQPARITKST
jgi:hypothetical protein